MAPPSTKPYRAVASADHDDGLGDGLDGPGVIATRSLDLELEQDETELQRSSPLRCKLLASVCLLAAVAFGGREYYVKTNNGERAAPEDGLEDAALSGPLTGIRGSSSNDYVGGSASTSEDLQYLEDHMGLVGGGDDDYLGGVKEYEGDVDDEIDNGEMEGEDVDYDEEVEEAIEEEAEEALEEEEEEAQDTDDSAIAGDDFYEEEANSGDVEDESEDPDASLVDDEGSQPTSPDEPQSEGEVAANGDEAEPLSTSTDEVETLPEEELPEDETQTNEGANPLPAPSEKDAADAPRVDELPDYFVPLTPAEREQMRERLRSTLRTTKNALLGKDELNPQRTLVLDKSLPKQFMHMHHMKTGGTSVDGLISCALSRQKTLHDGTAIDYSRMSECGSRVKTCMNDLAKRLDASLVDNVFYHNDGAGRRGSSFDPADDALDTTIDELNVCQTSESNVMSYCASLHAVRTFGWHGVDKVTVIRNPIDRAWSMYRFSLQRCYKCEEMKGVLKKVASGTFASKERTDATPDFVYSPNDSCAVQMIGHQATNLLSSVDLYNTANDVRFPREQEIVEEAVRNLREEFTWIGITDRLQESIDGMRAVFPFLAENLNDAAAEIEEVLRKSGEQVAEGGLSLPADYKDDKGCPLQHKNAGRDPTCGTKEMDEETIALVKSLNSRDMAVYAAALERFAIQQEVLEEYRAGAL
ncbi:hypothetical protein ACHAXT_003295 [Thalassiosira profunda]